MRACGLVNKGGIASRCKSQITKTPELRFRAVLGNNGDREEGDRLSASWKVCSRTASCPQPNLE